MLDKKSVYNGLEMICINFSIDKTQDQLKDFCRVIYPLMVRNNVTNQDFEMAVVEFMQKEDTAFNKLPTIGQFLGMMNKKPRTPEQMAQDACNKVFANITHFDTHILVDCKHTNWVITNSCGGLSSFKENWLLIYKEDKKALPFKKKEFVECWLYAYENNLVRLEPIKSDSYTSSDKLYIIGTEQKAAAMLGCDSNNIEQFLIENKKEVKSNLLIEDLASKMKG